MTPFRVTPAPEPQVTHHVYRNIVAIGTDRQLYNVITNHRNKGTFVGVVAATPLSGNRSQVVMRLCEPRSFRAATRTPATKSRRTRIAVIVTAVTATTAGLVALAAYLIGQLVELVVAHAGQILGVLVLAAILAIVAARRGSSGGRHCPGC